MSFAHDILGEKERKQREARLRDGLNQAKKETTTAGSGSGERWTGWKLESTVVAWEKTEEK